jgi:hypothetical protein
MRSVGQSEERQDFSDFFVLKYLPLIELDLRSNDVIEVDQSDSKDEWATWWGQKHGFPLCLLRC